MRRGLGVVSNCHKSLWTHNIKNSAIVLVTQATDEVLYWSNENKKYIKSRNSQIQHGLMII